MAFIFIVKAVILRCLLFGKITCILLVYCCSNSQNTSWGCCVARTTWAVVAKETASRVLSESTSRYMVHPVLLMRSFESVSDSTSYTGRIHQWALIIVCSVYIYMAWDIKRIGGYHAI